MERVHVNASKSYDITITDGQDELADAVLPFVRGKRVAIITDSNVGALYAKDMCRALGGEALTVPAGEDSKSFEMYGRLISELASRAFSRSDVVVTLGGGVVCDLGAFVASTYMRGITLVSAPTTVLAAVDASVGGKTAINLPEGKNLCGTFYQPDAVYINTKYFSTLPERELLSGMGEVLKYALLDGRVTRADVLAGATQQTVRRCLEIKRDIVQADEREGGPRKLLNLGHTVGHAIESLSGYAISHGECVAKGMAYAIKIAQRLHLATADAAARMSELVCACGHDLSCPYSPEQLAEHIMYDKKRSGKTITLVLPRDIGCPELCDIPLEQLKELL